MEIFTTISKIFQILRTLGPRWALARLWQEWIRRTGVLWLRTPKRRWRGGFESSIPKALPFDLKAVQKNLREVPSAEANRPEEYTAGLSLRNAERILGGELPWFSAHWFSTGTLPDWFEDPFSGQHFFPSGHWSRIKVPAEPDIKCIWELSRFTWVFPLARAYARTEDPEIPQRFWVLWEDWITHNPPNSGPQWMCGQEAAVRLISWTFALAAFREASSTTAERLGKMEEAIRVSGQRIRGNLSAALLQKNNHGILECAGLLTASRMIPRHSKADAWATTARDHLDKEVAELFYPGGDFAQHSTNYERFALQALLWVVAMEKAAGECPSPLWMDALDRGSRFLASVTAVESGAAPNSGGNDGAWLLPLSECPYWDFRPVIQAAAVCATGRPIYPRGPWDEDCAWLGFRPQGERELQNSEPREKRGPSSTVDKRQPLANCHALRRGDWLTVLRCPTVFRHRPAHADLAHLDLFWRGIPIAVDAGSFSYHDPGSFRHALRPTRFHNTVTVDGCEQMEEVGRFLLLPWLGVDHSETGSDSSEDLEWAMTAHSAYKRLFPGTTHERVVVGDGAGVWVIDRLRSNAKHRFRLHWLINASLREESDGDGIRHYRFRPDGSDEDLHLLCGSTIVPTGSDHIYAEACSDRGWWSPGYREKRPASSLALEAEATEVLFFSRFSCNPEPPKVFRDRLECTMGKKTIVFPASGPLPANIRPSDALKK